MISESGFRKVTAGIYFAAAPMMLLILWFTLTPEIVPKKIFPSPSSVWSAALTMRSDIKMHAYATFKIAIVGWTLGSISGVLIAVLMAQYLSFRRVALSLIEPVRPLPVVAWIPFFAVWFSGAGYSGPVFVVGLGCFLIVLVATYSAIEQFPPVFIKAAKSLGASQAKLFSNVILPGIIPAVSPALRTAGGMAFGLTVAAEIVGRQQGLGFIMNISRRNLGTDTILLMLIVLGIGALAFDLMLVSCLKWINHWQGTSLNALKKDIHS